MTVSTKEQAWAEADKIFPTDYEKDQDASVRAGYDIYKHSSNCNYDRIADLGNRLEVIVDNKATNIWIDEPKLKLKDFLKMVKEPIQIIVKKEEQCFEYACLSTGFHAEEAMEKTVYEVSSTVTFGANAKMSVSVW